MIWFNHRAAQYKRSSKHGTLAIYAASLLCILSLQSVCTQAYAQQSNRRYQKKSRTAQDPKVVIRVSGLPQTTYRKGWTAERGVFRIANKRQGKYGKLIANTTADLYLARDWRAWSGLVAEAVSWARPPASYTWEIVRNGGASLTHPTGSPLNTTSNQYFFNLLLDSSGTWGSGDPVTTEFKVTARAGGVSQFTRAGAAVITWHRDWENPRALSRNGFGPFEVWHRYEAIPGTTSGESGGPQTQVSAKYDVFKHRVEYLLDAVANTGKATATVLAFWPGAQKPALVLAAVGVSAELLKEMDGGSSSIPSAVITSWQILKGEDPEYNFLKPMIVKRPDAGDLQSNSYEEYNLEPFLAAKFIGTWHRGNEYAVDGFWRESDAYKETYSGKVGLGDFVKDTQL